MTVNAGFNTEPQVFRANFSKLATKRKANKPLPSFSAINEKALKTIIRYATDYFNPNMKFLITHHYRTLDAGYLVLREHGIKVGKWTFNQRAAHYYVMNLLSIYFGYELPELLSRRLTLDDMKPLPIIE